MKSNCNVWAWREFCEGRTDVMCLRKTHYSHIDKAAHHPLWRATLKPVGAVIGYPAWAMVQVAWWLMFGKWAHVTTCTREFVPHEEKRRHIVPPVWFHGREQDVERSWTE